MKKIPIIEKIAVILFGLFLCLIILEIGLRIGGFIFLSLQKYRNQISIKQKGSYRILCLGDSMTAGQYPRYLEKTLDKRIQGVKFIVIDKAKVGATSRSIMFTLNENLDRYNPDMVIAMIGSNDKGDILPYGNISLKKEMFFKTLRLIKILCYHIGNKTEKQTIFKIDNKNQNEDGPKEISDITETEREYNRAIEIIPYDKMKYIDLTCLYIEHGRYGESIELLEKIRQINRDNDELYIELGWLYRHQKDYNKSKEILKKAVEINPKNSQAYIELGYWYMEKREYDKIEPMFKKAIEANPKNSNAYTELGWWYKEQRDYNKAIEVLKKAIEVSPRDSKSYRGLVSCYNELGESKLSEEYSKKAELLRIEYYNPMTYNNYNRLKEIVIKRGIKLACMQYPTHSVESLKKLFEDNKGIIFVDNEKIFKEALKRAKYNEYFMDMFGGDFGHCTEKGNRLLAENIADTILKECFNKWTK